ncbi:MAG: hypothetical protein MI784_15995 [Cytophagales bacterium]|nr:hypothetical protein [Cytophagales bacterium]
MEKTLANAALVTKDEIVKGRVVRVRKISRHLIFLVVSTSGRLVECVYEHPPKKIKAGDFITAEGQWNPEGGHSKKFEIIRLSEQNCPDARSKQRHKAAEPGRIEAQFVRSVLEAQTHIYFTQEEFRLVNTPVLVGDWVLGQTKSFEVSVFGNQSCYLTISSILYHQVIQSQGYDRIYEIARLFRRENASSRRKLVEFSNVVVSIFSADLQPLMKIFSDYIRFLHRKISELDLKHLKLPPAPEFDTVSYRDLLKASGLDQASGHQLPLAVREYMDAVYEGFVWVTEFPRHTRPFYVKESGGWCRDCQLWYKGRNYLATGGLIETDLDKIARGIECEGKELSRFEFYTDALAMGVPSIANMDAGLERLLGTWFEDSSNSEFTFFPRFKGNIT